MNPANILSWNLNLNFQFIKIDKFSQSASRSGCAAIAKLGGYDGSIKGCIEIMFRSPDFQILDGEVKFENIVPGQQCLESLVFCSR